MGKRPAPWKADLGEYTADIGLWVWNLLGTTAISVLLLVVAELGTGRVMDLPLAILGMFLLALLIVGPFMAYRKQRERLTKDNASYEAEFRAMRAELQSAIENFDFEIGNSRAQADDWNKKYVGLALHIDGLYEQLDAANKKLAAIREKELEEGKGL